MNQVFLNTRLLERKPIRFTPAGIPVQELVLEHCSEVIEAGHTRRVEFIIAACAIGQLVDQLQHLQVGDVFGVEGFLAPARKNATKLVLHIQAVRFNRV